VRARTKPVKFTFDLGERRPVHVVVHPNGVVEFRLHHKRMKYEAHMRSLFTKALHNFAEDEKEKKKAARLAKRAAR
jgi:hypothetical protein